MHAKSFIIAVLSLQKSYNVSAVNTAEIQLGCREA